MIWGSTGHCANAGWWVNSLVLPLKGIQKTTLIDYPGVIASTIFLGGCNFRCPYCHNPTLVTGAGALPDISVEEMLAYVAGRKNLIDGICITGGEPTLFDELPDFIRKLKIIGYKVKLDTNGARPEMLEKLLNEGLLDFVAMDIKAPRERYAEAAGCPVDLALIDRSIELLKAGKVPYELRSTIVPRFFKETDIEPLGLWLQGATCYYLQRFEKTVPLLDPKFADEPSYLLKDLERFAVILRKYIKQVAVR